MKLQDLFENEEYGGSDYYCEPGVTKLPGNRPYPNKIKGFSCIYNDNLQSFEGAPNEINGKFSCQYCYLLSNLIGAPQEGVTDFSCYKCKVLSSLEKITLISLANLISLITLPTIF